MNEEILVALGFLAAVILIIYILARYNYLIRSKIVEQGGYDASGQTKYSFFDVGCIVLSFGIGLGFSSIFTTMEIAEETMYLLIYATIFSCGGLGLLVAHYIRKKFDDR